MEAGMEASKRRGSRELTSHIQLMNEIFPSRPDSPCLVPCDRSGPAYRLSPSDLEHTTAMEASKQSLLTDLSTMEMLMNEIFPSRPDSPCLVPCDRSDLAHRPWRRRHRLEAAMEASKGEEKLNEIFPSRPDSLCLVPCDRSGPAYRLSPSDLEHTTAMEASKQSLLTDLSTMEMLMNEWQKRRKKRYLDCKPDEYLLGERCCRLCPAGTHVARDCTRSRSTVCRTCTEGTYTDQPTRNLMCSDCTNCDADSGLTVKTPCTTTSDTVCEPLEGFYCVVSTDRGCRAAEKHSSCSPGQFISQNGTALSNTVCLNCTDGTFSNGTSTSCQPYAKFGVLALWLTNPGIIILGIVAFFFICRAIISLFLKKKKAAKRKKSVHKKTRIDEETSQTFLNE